MSTASSFESEFTNLYIFADLIEDSSKTSKNFSLKEVLRSSKVVFIASSGSSSFLIVSDKLACIFSNGIIKFGFESPTVEV